MDKIDEDWVKKEVKILLKPFAAEMHWWMPSAGTYGKSGTHDFIITQNGLSWTIETKAGKNKPTDLQIDFANNIAKAGGISLCINEWTLAEVTYVAKYIETNLAHPAGHDFETYRKKAGKPK
ncbi:MAG: hypothetical protein V4649_19495 [Bacteroidota bacterium]